MLYLGLLLVTIICFLPLIPGVLGILAPAFGWLPNAEYSMSLLIGWQELFNWPTFPIATGLTLFIAFFSTLFSILFSFIILYFYGTKKNGVGLNFLYLP